LYLSFFIVIIVGGDLRDIFHEFLFDRRLWGRARVFMLVSVVSLVSKKVLKPSFLIRKITRCLPYWVILIKRHFLALRVLRLIGIQLCVFSCQFDTLNVDLLWKRKDFWWNSRLTLMNTFLWKTSFLIVLGICDSFEYVLLPLKTWEKDLNFLLLKDLSTWNDDVLTWKTESWMGMKCWIE
jgi:hypothetical protein